MPILGYGTWKTKPEDAYAGTKHAIEAGYRHIDAAHCYGNEKEVGDAIKSKIDDGTVRREDLFITGKLWNTYHRRHLVTKGLQATLDDLQTDYLDLFLMHWPTAYKEGPERFPKDENDNFLYSDGPTEDTWKGMEDEFDKGKARALGISNFNHLQIEELLGYARIKPVSQQIEVHPYFKQTKMRHFCAKHGITVTAHSCIGSRDRPWVTDTPDHPYILRDPVVYSIAEKWGKTPAQVVLRWNIQRGVVVIPKSITPSRIRSNIQCFDFELDESDMFKLNSFHEKYYRGMPHNWLLDHPHYPFHEDY